jgi:hypothetical protein
MRRGALVMLARALGVVRGIMRGSPQMGHAVCLADTR